MSTKPPTKNAWVKRKVAFGITDEHDDMLTELLTKAKATDRRTTTTDVILAAIALAHKYQIYG